MNDNSEVAQARMVLRDWFLRRGEKNFASGLDTWKGTAGPAACAFVPSGGLSNRIYLVKGDRVFDFAPSEMGFGEAIGRLGD